MPGAPTAVLCGNYGDGRSVAVSWTPPGDWTPAGYDVYAATENDLDEATRRNTHLVPRETFIVQGFNDGDVVYAWVVGIAADGSEGDYSAVSRSGTMARVTGTMTIDGPVGDNVASGRTFSCKVGNDLIAFRTTAAATIT